MLTPTLGQAVSILLRPRTEASSKSGLMAG